MNPSYYYNSNPYYYSNPTAYFERILNEKNSIIQQLQKEISYNQIVINQLNQKTDNAKSIINEQNLVITRQEKEIENKDITINDYIIEINSLKSNLHNNNSNKNLLDSNFKLTEQLKKSNEKILIQAEYLEKIIGHKNILIDDLEDQNKKKDLTILNLENELKNMQRKKLNIIYDYYKD